MYFTRLRLKNWRNFVKVDLPLGERLFITGPNASGKSNLLDAFRFIRDIAKTGGGLQQAVLERGGLSKIRCLAARRYPDVELEFELDRPGEDKPPTWRYAIGLRQQQRGPRSCLLTYEKVWRNDKLILDRPDLNDQKDILRMTQTHLEQISANKSFRDISDAACLVSYLHLVPQLLKHPNLANREAATEDPFGLAFLERLMRTPEKTRRARLKKIEHALKLAVPELEDLTDIRDERGVPHLEATYRHWRSKGGKQQEDQFSDGTLRLIGLLWSLLDGESLLLLEEPELSLHTHIVAKLPSLIWRMQRSRKRQVIISSHSAELFGDPGISPEHVAILVPQGSEGTSVRLAADVAEVGLLLEAGMSIGEAVLPMTAPSGVEQLNLFK